MAVMAVLVTAWAGATAEGSFGLALVSRPPSLALDPVVGAAGAVAALALVMMWLVAAGTKLASPGRTADDFARLGLPVPRLVAWLVPLAEVVAAVALVLAPKVGALVSVALLGPFTAVTVGAVRSGRRVRCHCFGRMSRSPASKRTVARNAVLLAVAGVAGLGPPLWPPHGATLAVAAGSLGGGALVVAVIVELARLRSVTGRLWSVDLGRSRS